MLLTNNQIIIFYNKMTEAFNDNKHYFPAKINFIISKNLLKLQNLTEEIYKVRESIIKHYGTPTDNEDYYISKDNHENAQKELDELLEIKQDVGILIISLKDIEHLEFTSNQMQAIMFMIEEKDEDQVE